MKKAVLGVLICILLISLIISGCKSGTTTTSTTAGSTTSTTTTTTTTTSKPATTTSSPQPTLITQTYATTTSTTASATTPASASDLPIPLVPNVQRGGTIIFNHNAQMSFISAPADGPQLSQRVARCVFEPLLICDIKENIQPWLATAWTVSPDGKTITLKLRQGVKFSDGTDFNAEAVKFNWELDLKNNITGSAPLKNVASYGIPDPYTIVVNLKAPDATFLLYLSQGLIGLMASPTAQQKPTTPETITQVHMVGTGPFLYDSWQRDNYVQFKANPNYWQKGKPYLDGIRFNFIADFTASLLAFRSGQANVVLTLDPVDAVQLKKDGYKVYLAPLNMIHWLVPDGSNPDSPFAKLAVRQAVEYMINKNDLAAIGSGYFFPADQFAVSSNPYYDSTIVPRSYNLAKAKELLTSAGYPNGFDMTVITNQSIRVDTENLILAQLKAGGINVTRVDVQTSAAYSTTTQKGWKTSVPGVASLLMPGFPIANNTTGLISRFNTTLYPDQYWPAGLVQGWQTVSTQIDDTKRYEQMKTLIRQIFDTCATFPYITDASRFVTDNKVQGWAEYYYANNSPDYYQAAELWLKTK
jgi:peptide/nickel transport system substrate-binding protein